MADMLNARSRQFRKCFPLLLAIVAVIVQGLAASPQRGHDSGSPAVGMEAPWTSSDPPQAVPRNHDRWHPSSAYFLVAPLDSGSTYLVDDELRVVNEWRSDYGPGLSAYLLNDGTLLRAATIGNSRFNAAGGNGGRIELYLVAWRPPMEY